MLQRLIGVILGFVVLAGTLLGFEVRAVIKKIDVDKSVITVDAGGRERTARVAKDVKVSDEKGQAGSVGELLQHTNWDDYFAILLDRRLPDGRAEEVLPRFAGAGAALGRPDRDRSRRPARRRRCLAARRD